MAAPWIPINNNVNNIAIVEITDGSNILGTVAHPVIVSGDINTTVTFSGVIISLSGASIEIGTVAVSGIVDTSGTTTVTNFPANQSISGVVELLGTSNVNVTNAITANIAQPITVQGAVGISGNPSINIANPITVVGISGDPAVSISNFPAVQTIQGAVSVSGITLNIGTIAVSGVVVESGVVLANQGSPTTLASGWPVELTDGTNILGTSIHPVIISGNVITSVTVNPVANQSISGVVEISNGTNIVGTTASPLIISGNTNTTVSFPSNQNVTVLNPVNTVGISGIVPNLTVSGSVFVNNFPANQSISGVVLVNQGTNPWAISGTYINQILQPISISGTPTTNWTQVNGVTVDTNIGNATAGTQRIVLASNQPTLTVSGVTVTTGTSTVSGTVTVLNFPGTQPISGTVTANVTQPIQVIGSVAVTGTPSVNINNLTSTQVVSGVVQITGVPSVSINNFPTNQSISGVVLANQGTSPWIISGNTNTTVVFPGNQNVTVLNPVNSIAITGVVPNLTVSGSVFVNNSNQVISGIVQITGVPTVSVTNFPTNQSVSGVVEIFDGTNVLGTTAHPVIISGNVITSVGILTPPVTVVGISGVVPNLTVSGVVEIFDGSNVVGTTLHPLIISGNTNTTVNFPASQNVTVLNPINSVAITGVVPNLTVSGVMNIGNFPPNQSVSGVVTILNFPSTQTVAGTVTANIAQPVTVQGAITITGTPTVIVNQGTNPWTVSGSVFVNNPNQVISGVVQITGVPTVLVSNFPVNQEISGTVFVNNFPTNQTISGVVLANQGTSPWIISGNTNTTVNFPSNQNVTILNPVVGISGIVPNLTVSGIVNIGNFPTNQEISGVVFVNNFPASQTINGTVTANITQPVQVIGSVGVSGLTTLTVSGTYINQILQPVAISGTVPVSILSPITANIIQPITIQGGVYVSGNTVSTPLIVSGSYISQILQPIAISGIPTVSVNNFPSNQNVTVLNPVNTVGISGIVPNLTVSGVVFVNNPNQVISGVVQITGVPTMTANQGTANSPSNAWPISVNSAGNTALVIQPTTDASSSTYGLTTTSQTEVFNGASWDRLRGSATNGIVLSGFTTIPIVAISGIPTVSVSSFPATQTVSGSIFINNSNQIVSGVVQVTGVPTVNLTATIPIPISGNPAITYATPTTDAYSEAIIQISGAGNNIIIPSGNGQTIRVWRMFGAVSGITNLTIAGNGNFTGPMYMGTGGSFMYDPSPFPWFTTGVGSGFIFNLSSPANIAGRIYYTQS